MRVVAVVVGVDEHANRLRRDAGERLEERPGAALGGAGVDGDDAVGAVTNAAVVDPPRAVGLDVGEDAAVDLLQPRRAEWRSPGRARLRDACSTVSPPRVGGGVHLGPPSAVGVRQDGRRGGSTGREPWRIAAGHRRARTDRAGVDRRAAGAAARHGCGGRSATPTSTSSTPAGRSTRPASTPRTAASSPTWPGSRSPPRPTCASSTRSGCSPSRARRSSASTPRPARPAADGRRLDGGRPRHVGAARRPLDARRRRPPRRSRAQRLRLRPVHRRARGPRRRRAARLHRHPGLRRDDRAAGAVDPGLRARGHHGHAVVHAGDRRRDGAPGRSTPARRRCRSGSSGPSRGPTTCASSWRTASTCTPSTCTASPR